MGCGISRSRRPPLTATTVRTSRCSPANIPAGSLAIMVRLSPAPDAAP
jgi:hypothetical protein